MLVEKITSRQNPLIRKLRRARTGADRHLIFLEGVRLMEDALRAGVHFDSVAFSPALEATERGVALLDSLRHVPCRGAHLSPQVMEAVAATDATQGVVATITRPHFEPSQLFEGDSPLLVIADQLQDPGNIGAIIRTAEAAGATGLITIRHTVDPYNHKSLRGSMGSALRLPIAVDARLPLVVDLCREKRVKLVATRPPRSKSGLVRDATRAAVVTRYTEATLSGSVALVFGREGTGVADETSAEVDEFVYIPTVERVESLNVAAAAAVVLYEAARQRGFKGMEPALPPRRRRRPKER